MYDGMYFVFFSRAKVYLNMHYLIQFLIFLALIVPMHFDLETMPFMKKLTTVENVVVRDLVALKNCLHVWLLKFQIVNMSGVRFVPIVSKLYY